jgi:hypothetical protein
VHNIMAEIHLVVFVTLPKSINVFQNISHIHIKECRELLEDVNRFLKLFCTPATYFNIKITS